jgi:glycosyltransferase involved in cell wall biosynthesis
MEPLAYSDRNNPASEKIRNFIRKKVSLSAFNSSRRIIAVSQYVKKFLISELGIPETKIGVVYHGASDIGTIQSRPKIIPKECKGRFLFTAGSIRPARGLEDIINAVALLVKKQIDIKLVIAGFTAPNMLSYRSSLQNIISKNGVHDRIIWAGNLRSQEMDWCYKNCRAFIMSSRIESFGITATEAMAGGCICISADNPCLPELFGDASIYYPPKDGKLLADMIKTILAWGDNQRKVMSEKAKKRAAEFSWDVCAKKTVAELVKTTDT